MPKELLNLHEVRLLALRQPGSHIMPQRVESEFLDFGGLAQPLEHVADGGLQPGVRAAAAARTFSTSAGDGTYLAKPSSGYMGIARNGLNGSSSRHQFHSALTVRSRLLADLLLCSSRM